MATMTIDWTLGGVELLDGNGLAVEIKDDCETYCALVPEGSTPAEMVFEFCRTYDFNGSLAAVPCSAQVFDGSGDSWQPVNAWQFEAVQEVA
jgi:hypothetical protein